MLEDLFLQGKPMEEIERIKGEFSIVATDTEAYLCFVSLYLIGLEKALRSAEFHVAPSTVAKISQTLESSLLAHLSPFGLLSMDADAVPKKFSEITERLLGLWKESLEKIPGPDWYVAKEVCFLLKGRDREPPPDLIFKFSSLVTNYLTSIKALFGRIETEYLLVK